MIGQGSRESVDGVLQLKPVLRSVRRRFLKFGFYLLYNPLAFTYDAVAALVSLGQWQTWAETAVSRVRGSRVLELGHGPGHLLIALARSGRLQPIGLDLSPNMIKQARQRIRRSGLSIPQVRCRVQALPFRSGVFDSVVATFPTEYIADPATLYEIQRVTNERGRLVVVAGVQLGRQQPGTRFIDWLYRVTGQNEPVSGGFRSIFDQAGMPVRIESETIGVSTVMLMIAEKPHTG